MTDAFWKSAVGKYIYDEYREKDEKLAELERKSRGTAAEQLEVFDAKTIPEFLLPRLAGSEYATVRSLTAHHVLRRLTGTLSAEGRKHVTSAEAILAFDDTQHVRSIIASGTRNTSLLDRLVRDSNTGIGARRKAAANRFVSEGSLRFILQQDPDPAFSFDLLEVRHIPPKVLETLVNDPRFAKSAANYYLQRRGMAQYRHFYLKIEHPEALAVLGETPDIELRRYAANHVGTPPEALIPHDGDILQRFFLAGNPRALPHVLAELSKDPQDKVRVALAKNPKAPDSALLQMAEEDRTSLVLEALATRHAEVQFRVARNPHTSGRVLEKLAKSDDKAVQIAALQHTNFKPSALGWWATAGDWECRIAVASNLSFGNLDAEVMAKQEERPEVLRVLMRSTRSEAVRARIIRNSAFPEEELRPFMYSKSGRIKAELALVSSTMSDEALGLEIQQKLAADPDAEVRGRVAAVTECPQLLDELRRDEAEVVLHGLLENPNLTEDHMVDMVPGASEHLCLKLLKRPGGPPERVLEWAVGHSSDRVQAAVVECLEASTLSISDVRRLLNLIEEPAALRKMATSARVDFQRIAATKPGSHLRRMAEDAPLGDTILCLTLASNPACPPSALRTLFQRCGTGGSVAFRLAENLQTPPDVLKDMACDRSDALRKTVAKHPSTPAEALEKLAKDESPAVRQAVRTLKGIEVHKVLEQGFRSGFKPSHMQRLSALLSEVQGLAPKCAPHLPGPPEEMEKFLELCEALNAHCQDAAPVVEPPPVEESVGKVVGAAVMTAVLKNLHPAAPLVTEAGRNLAVADKVQQVLSGDS